MDPLTDVLRGLRLSGAVFLDAVFTAPWCITARVGPEDCRPFLADPPACMIAYHYVIEGRLRVGIEGRAPVSAAARQLLVLPRNDPHRLGSALSREPRAVDELIEPASEDGLGRIRHGGGGARTRILCGFLGGDDPSDPLLASLPPLLALDLRDRPVGAWIEGSMRYAAAELAAGGAGAASSLGRLAELLFAEAVRQYANALPEDGTGWLAGLRDPQVGHALALLHGRLAHRWTLEELAREVGVSRSVLTERFRRLLGVGPMRYLTRRRLQQAADHLRRDGEALARIADDVGYASEAAFCRAFKREFGVSPGAFRGGSRGPARA